MIKGFFFFFVGIIALMSVIGGIEQTVDIGFLDAIQLFSFGMVGIIWMIIGVSYLKGE
jgi:hypothetical protein